MHGSELNSRNVLLRPHTYANSHFPSHVLPSPREFSPPLLSSLPPRRRLAKTTDKGGRTCRVPYVLHSRIIWPSLRTFFNYETMAQGQAMDRAFPGEDRFSELLDALRLHILSLLPRKDAVRTGTLSTKWKGLWKKRFPHLTNLNLGRRYEREEDQSAIARGIEQYMSRHCDKKIETFNLYFNPGKDFREMTTKWIKQATTNRVEELYLDFSQGNLGNNASGRLGRRMKKFELKEYVFKSNDWLTILSLSYCNLPRSFKFRYFSSLETLYLHGINLNNNMFTKLVANCQRLKALELRECMPVESIMVKPRHLYLQSLTIANCHHVETVDIAAPSLHSFHFLGMVRKTHILVEDTSSLRSVIMISSIYRYIHITFRPPCMFMMLNHVQVLTICSSSLEFMNAVCSNVWLTCRNIRELHLLVSKMNDGDFANIFRFFGQCQLQLLERLFIELPSSLSESSTGSQQRVVAEGRGHQTFPQLKKIKMNNFKGHRNEMLLLDFLLRVAVNLESIILVFSDEYGTSTSTADMVSLCHELSRRPRASNNVQLLLAYSSQDIQGMMIRPTHSEVVRGLRAREPQIAPRM